ncbi:hypothetical protein N7526_009096 [Penicillium atrosanguineum]|nr:hypothetical protein N7526_009096 [Penicillium atrosanguineum]
MSETARPREPAREPAKSKSRKTDPNAPIRKRRKRTVVSGAPDDCFTCSKRGARCDRRRPYCSQCLELGRECSGYKTTLTWGVGVASRGKLRGQKLPVMDEGAAESSKKTSNAQQRSPSSSGGQAQSSSQRTSTTPPAAPSSGMGFSSFDAGSFNSFDSDSRRPSVASNVPDMSNGIAWTMDMPDPQTWSSMSAAHPQISGLPLPNRPAMGSRSSPSISSEDAHPVCGISSVISPKSLPPMIVAFDTPSNPFRTHVLRLAQGSEALQEAIATLATSNLRQRREKNHMSTERTLPARMSSMAHRALTDEDFQDRYGISMSEGYIREENHHRGMAVKALNADLADPRRRLSDSVLATLLILCLFHGCDTGVAEFRTQFAGVTRLLAIRMRHSPVLTDDIKWFIRMFSWFDTLTATTNDRDVQLRGKCLEISSITDGEWGLENLAGCDGRLFKMISQLGRLNLLSQDQQPNESRPADVTIPTASLPPSMIFPGWDSVPLASGSGAMAGDYGYSMPTPPQSSDQARRPSSPAFWTEWYSLRQRLESWRFDPPTGPPVEASFSSPTLSASTLSFNPSQFTPTPPTSPSYQVANENLQDVYQISECFRHAALLYCERLAEPSLPSQHPRIQHLVLLAMHCLFAVQSDVYLLWPLFIVGSECVQEDHRSAVRNRCRDISKDSGFVNNISCLELLEKIWAEHSEESSYPVYPSDLGPPPPLDGSGKTITSQAFRWSRVMQAKRGDGEYMVA